MEFIHNSKKRMSVILSPDDEKFWLSEYLDKEQINSLLKPFDDGAMISYIIGNDFLRKSSKDASITLGAV